MSLDDTKVGKGWPAAPGSRRDAYIVSPRGRVIRDRRRWRWSWVLAAVATLVLMAGGILMGMAASYQPALTYGGAGVSNLAYPGLPAGVGVRTVNTFGHVREDVYIPPQRQGYTFFLFADVQNSGSRAVTIEAVTLPQYSVLRPSGQIRYSRPSMQEGAPAIPFATHVLRNVTLGPGQAIFLAIPVRSWPCWTKYGALATVPYFHVTYRFLFFTHTVAFPWNPQNGELILHTPASPGQPGTVCIT